MAHALANRPSVNFNKQQVKSKNKFRIKNLPQSLTIILATLLVVAITLSFVWKNLVCVDYGYKIADLESELQQALKLNNELTAENGTLCASGRIDRLAKQELGFVPAKVYGIVPSGN